MNFMELIWLFQPRGDLYTNAEKRARINREVLEDQAVMASAQAAASRAGGHDAV